MLEDKAHELLRGCDGGTSTVRREACEGMLYEFMGSGGPAPGGGQSAGVASERRERERGRWSERPSGGGRGGNAWERRWGGEGKDRKRWREEEWRESRAAVRERESEKGGGKRARDRNGHMAPESQNGDVLCHSL